MSKKTADRKVGNISPMYFTSLEVENVKCFGSKQILDLTDSNGAISPWTLILGDNGVGKTSILKCLAWMRPVEESDPIKKDEAKIQKVAIKPFMDDFEHESQYEELVKTGNEISASIKVSFANGVQLGEIVPEEFTVSYSFYIETALGKLKEVKAELSELEIFNGPNIFGYSASRHMESKNFDNTELEDPTQNLFSSSGVLYDAEQLLSMLDNAAIRENNSGKAHDLLEKVKQILVDLLPDVKNTSSIKVNSPINPDGSLNKVLVEIETSDGYVKLQDLSLGYQTMLAWVLDLAVRMLWKNPESKTPLQEPAVVIVDEIDLHLHPKWQRMVKKYLTYHFPKTQFICTAHSPFLAQSAETDNLCVIHRQNNKVIIENEPYIVEGWRIGQIVTSDLFGVPSERSPEIEALVNRQNVLLDKLRLNPDEEEELTRIEDAIAKLPVLENQENQELLDTIKRMTQKP
jgi:predicted ATP-binding protein involved in virulence